MLKSLCQCVICKKKDQEFVEFLVLFFKVKTKTVLLVKKVFNTKNTFLKNRKSLQNINERKLKVKFM